MVEILFLGTGDAFNTDGRASQSVWVDPKGGSPFLVDVGPTAMASMARSRADPDKVDRVFFTHLHGDHIAGWPFLLLHVGFIAHRSRPISVFGPAGTRKRLETLAASCYDDLAAGKDFPFPLEYREIPVARGEGLDGGDGLRFDVVPLDHHATTIGYRFRVAGRTIGVSGDTRWCPGLEELGRGCDLLILECTCVEKPTYAHVSLDEVRDGFGRLGSKKVALVHLSDRVARALEKEPVPGVLAAEDGMILKV